MGSKASLLAFARQRPRAALRPGLVADEAEARLLAATVLAVEGLEPAGPRVLDEVVRPKPRLVCAGQFADVDILTSQDLGRSCPSELAEYVSRTGSLRLSPDEGVIEQIGNPLPLERGFWAGQHPVRHAPGYPCPSTRWIWATKSCGSSAGSSSKAGSTTAASIPTSRCHPSTKQTSRPGRRSCGAAAQRMVRAK